MAQRSAGRRITNLRSASIIMKTTLSKGADSIVAAYVSFTSKSCLVDVLRRPRKNPVKKMKTPSGMIKFATRKSKICWSRVMFERWSSCRQLSVELSKSQFGVSSPKWSSSQHRCVSLIYYVQITEVSEGGKVEQLTKQSFEVANDRV